MVSNTAGVRPKKVPGGFYDPEILCAECDSNIGNWDQYGIELFAGALSGFAAVPSESEPVAFLRTNYDYRKLKLFSLSLLWRADRTAHPMFNRVKLGQHRERLTSLIAAGDPGTPTDFGTAFSVFTVNGRPFKGSVPIMDPFRERWNGVNAYRFSLGAVTAYVKVDQLPFPPHLAYVALNPEKPLALIAREWFESSEYQVARKIVQVPGNSRLFPEAPAGSERDDA
ncbi:MAG: hypothetical protein JNL44_09940 [Gemmatimonadetes bacterium]|nr:hypothetical protein [Gemmatimonadota bacterium]